MKGNSAELRLCGGPSECKIFLVDTFAGEATNYFTHRYLAVIAAATRGTNTLGEVHHHLRVRD